MNEYTFKDFGLKLPTNLNIRDIANPSTALGKVWVNFVRELDGISCEIVTGSTIAGSGVTGLAVPTKVPAGAAH